MMDPILNRDLLPHNECFGCGLENAAGLAGLPSGRP